MNKLCCFFVLVCVLLGCFYFPNIVGRNAEIVSSGRITAIDEEASSIKVIDNEYKFYQYDLSLEDRFLGNEFQHGDKVFIYNNHDETYASAINLDDAKVIDTFLWGYFYEKLVNPWVIFALYLVLCPAMYWIVFGLKYRDKIKRLLIFLTFLLPLCLEPNFKLFYLNNGEVVKITDDNKVETKDGKSIDLCKNVDMVTGDKIKEGDFVYFYRYGLSDNPEFPKIFASTKIFDHRTLLFDKIYPNIYLLSICIIVVIMLSFVVLWTEIKKEG